MEKYQDKSLFAREKLSTEAYQQEIQELQDDLRNLREELRETKVEVLENDGYKLVNVDDMELLVPTTVGLEQLLNLLQQVPPDMSDEYMLTYLVSDEDRKQMSESDEYRAVVSEREQIVEEIRSVYERFWDEAVSEVATGDTESIVYMMSGLEQSIDSSTLSDITGVSERYCRDFYLDENGCVVRDSPL